MAEETEVMSARETIKSLPQSFWIANIMEIVERIAWYGFFALSSVYICGEVAEGGRT